MLTEAGVSKKCGKCGISKPVTEFSRQKKTADGFQFACKTCQVAYTRTRREKPENRERARHANRRDYERNKERRLAQYAALRIAHPERGAARMAIATAIRSGKIRAPQNCQQCGRQAKTEAHHRDYSKPLEVVWLCACCHKRIHASGETKEVEHAQS